ncbi:pectin acetylesterase 8 isoform X1 [Arachis ipaensis]|uniref:pectin acetylesterase 8 isoform X1 n=1 Tax=Arachis ipaensis TaxID=130454 RepID=UPI000A2B67FB|nr:pectin acetylesterase 8 isoform X1 [Arachis ipaensis]
MEIPRIWQWLNLLVCVLLLIKSEGSGFVPITYLEDAESKGAVCLDGSPPAYHFDKGSGEGVNSWIVHLEGGGWCSDVSSCLERKDTRLGSSKQMDTQAGFYGILNNQQDYNPDFYNWNRIKIRYCDGSSFTGDVEEVDPTNNLHFRGARIFEAVIKHLLAKGMENAENAILSGCSAGGLAAILNCDRFKSFLPNGARVKCAPDAGYFIHVPDVSGTKRIENFYKGVVETHGSAKYLSKSCTSKYGAGLCFFPQYVVQDIATPIFVVNAAYDSWQIRNILIPGMADPHGSWQNCRDDIGNCTPDQLDAVQGFREDFIKALSGVQNSPSKGMFIDSCYIHCQTGMQELWFNPDAPQLANTVCISNTHSLFLSALLILLLICRLLLRPLVTGFMNESLSNTLIVPSHATLLVVKSSYLIFLFSTKHKSNNNQETKVSIPQLVVFFHFTNKNTSKYKTYIGIACIFQKVNKLRYLVLQNILCLSSINPWGLPLM